MTDPITYTCEKCEGVPNLNGEPIAASVPFGRCRRLFGGLTCDGHWTVGTPHLRLRILGVESDTVTFQIAEQKWRGAQFAPWGRKAESYQEVTPYQILDAGCWPVMGVQCSTLLCVRGIDATRDNNQMDASVNRFMDIARAVRSYCAKAAEWEKRVGCEHEASDVDWTCKKCGVSLHPTQTFGKRIRCMRPLLSPKHAEQQKSVAIPYGMTVMSATINGEPADVREEGGNFIVSTKQLPPRGEDVEPKVENVREAEKPVEQKERERPRCRLRKPPFDLDVAVFLLPPPTFLPPNHPECRHRDEESAIEFDALRSAARKRLLIRARETPICPFGGKIAVDFVAGGPDGRWLMAYFRCSRCSIAAPTS